MAWLYLGLGANLGQREKTLQRAIERIQETIGPIVARSSFHYSEPWGFSSDNAFLNACLIVETDLDARACLRLTQNIEKELGRTMKTENAQYHDRLIDIDILFYDNLILNEKDLTIPHPLLHKREFVLKPLSEIAADFKHPVLQKSVAELLALLT